MNIVFLAYRDWALAVADSVSHTHAAGHQFVTLVSPEALREYVERRADGADVFVAIGWSWIIEADITTRFLCLGVHPSDLPDYRGGSPIQNQILDGVVHTKCSLFRLTERLDAGEIWGKSDLSLTGDSMGDILENIKTASITLLGNFLDRFPHIEPSAQDLSQGKLVKRRKPEDSRLSPADFDLADITRFYDKIRCLTAPYPNAFIEDEQGNRIYFEKIRFERGPRSGGA